MVRQSLPFSIIAVLALPLVIIEVGPVFAIERLGATSDDLNRTTQLLTLDLTGSSAGGFVPGGEAVPVAN